MMMMHSQLGRISLCCAILAAAVLQACAEDATTTSMAPSFSPTRFRCLGICGDEEGELEEPDKIVSYQWNSRVPVCAGLSCETASCAVLDEKLGLLEVTTFQCTRHRRDLQDTAGCTCSEPKQRPKLQDDVLLQKSDRNYYSSQHYDWTILIIVSVAYLLIWIGCWLGIRRDDKKAAEEGQEEEESEEP